MARGNTHIGRKQQCQVTGTAGAPPDPGQPNLQPHGDQRSWARFISMSIGHCCSPAADPPRVLVRRAEHFEAGKHHTSEVLGSPLPPPPPPRCPGSPAYHQHDLAGFILRRQEVTTSHVVQPDPPGACASSTTLLRYTRVLTRAQPDSHCRGSRRKVRRHDGSLRQLPSRHGGRP